MDDLDKTNIILLKCPGKSKDVAQICTSTVHYVMKESYERIKAVINNQALFR